LGLLCVSALRVTFLMPVLNHEGFEKISAQLKKG